MDVATAAQALKEIEGARASVAARAKCPPAWHYAFGALIGTMIAGLAGPPVVGLGVLVVAMACVGLMVRAQRRRMGFFVNGYRRGRTRRVALGLLAFFEAVLCVCMWLKIGRHIWWAPLLGGLLVAPVGVAGSYVWQRAYLRDLGEESLK